LIRCRREGVRKAGAGTNERERERAREGRVKGKELAFVPEAQAAKEGEDDDERRTVQ